MAVYIIDPDQKFQKAVNLAGKLVDDLTVPLTLITQSWFQGNKSIFLLKGPGKFVDLSEKYKLLKKRTVGFIYPILKSSGKLEGSLTDASHPNSIAQIINKKSLILGTNVESKKGAPYARFLHFGTKNMQARPVVLFGVEQVAPKALNKRVEIWANTLLDFAFVKSATFGKRKK